MSTSQKSRSLEALKSPTPATTPTPATESTLPAGLIALALLLGVLLWISVWVDSPTVWQEPGILP
jgi:hypothetical protein